MAQFAEFVSNHWVLFLELVIIVGVLLGTTVLAPLRGYKSIGPADVTRLINHEDAVVLDVREGNEFHEGHIVNSIHVPLSALKTRVGELEKFSSRPVIVSCRSGHRSANACSTLRKRGFKNLYNMGGGILAWKNANLPLTKKK